MTKFLGWYAPNGAVVIGCTREPGNKWGVDFDRVPCDDGGTRSGRVFFDDGEHVYGAIGKLIPPENPDWTKPLQLRDGTAITVLTTGALGEKPVIYQVAGDAELHRCGLHEVRNVPEEITVMVKLTVSADMKTVKAVEVVP